MPRVLISGYYGFDNLGDEAVLFSIVNRLREVAPGLDIAVLSARPEKTARSYNVEAYNRWRPGEVARALRKSDLFVSGGGSLLQDVTGLKSLAYYLGVIWLALKMGKPVFIYAQGIGPIRSKTGRFLARRILNRVQAITVRDQESCQDLLEMGVTTPVEITADPVLALRPEHIDRKLGTRILEQSGCNPAVNGNTAGISVREWQGQKGYEAAIARVADRLVRRGYQVVFLPMQYPEDADCSREVIGQMEEQASLIDRALTVPEVAAVISNLTLVVGMRLHALILAAVLGVPPVAVSYDPKIDRFMAMLGGKAAITVADPRLEKLWFEVERVLANPGTARQETEKATATLREKAGYTADILIQLL